MSGWPTQALGNEFQPYISRKNELSVLDGCILWSSRVIIPPQGRKPLLSELHNTHLGVSKMKALACSYIWWPGMDAEKSNRVLCARSPAHPQQPPHCTHGSGLQIHGAACIYTSQALSLDTCFSSLSMPTQSG